MDEINIRIGLLFNKFACTRDSNSSWSFRILIFTWWEVFDISIWFFTSNIRNGGFPSSRVFRSWPNGEIFHWWWCPFWFTNIAIHVLFSTAWWWFSSVFIDLPVVWRWSILINWVLHVEVWITAIVPSSCWYLNFNIFGFETCNSLF